jgi:hypothetical protein
VVVEVVVHTIHTSHYRLVYFLQDQIMSCINCVCHSSQ